MHRKLQLIALVLPVLFSFRVMANNDIESRLVDPPPKYEDNLFFDSNEKLKTYLLARKKLQEYTPSFANKTFTTIQHAYDSALEIGWIKKTKSRHKNWYKISQYVHEDDILVTLYLKGGRKLNLYINPDKRETVRMFSVYFNKRGFKTRSPHFSVGALEDAPDENCDFSIDGKVMRTLFINIRFHRDRDGQTRIHFENTKGIVRAPIGKLINQTIHEKELAVGWMFLKTDTEERKEYGINWARGNTDYMPELWVRAFKYFPASEKRLIENSLSGLSPDEETLQMAQNVLDELGLFL